MSTSINPFTIRPATTLPLPEPVFTMDPNGRWVWMIHTSTGYHSSAATFNTKLRAVEDANHYLRKLLNPLLF